MASQSTQLEETSRLWGEILNAVQGRLGSQQTFDTWFKPIQPIRLGPHAVELEVPNTFFVDWIHQHHLPALREVVAQVLGEGLEIRLSTQQAGTRSTTPARPSVVELQAPTSRKNLPASTETLLHPRYTFPNFVVGSSNQFTHAACRAVAERPGRAYNPLFIFAGSGLGKTHLLHAIGHAVQSARPDARVSYVSAERFTNEMIYAIQHAQTLAILRKRCEEEGDGIRLADDVLLLLADRIRNNIRDLEGCLVRVLALGSLMHQDVSIAMVEEILEHYVHPEPDQLAPERIVSTV